MQFQLGSQQLKVKIGLGLLGFKLGLRQLVVILLDINLKVEVQTKLVSKLGKTRRCIPHIKKKLELRLCQKSSIISTKKM
jgi:hypothetical protein